MPIDLEKARADTLGCEHRIHFNNAGASLMPRPVVDAVVNHLRLEEQIGGYEAAEQARESIDRVYDSVATLIGCARDEVAIIENATRAWDMAFYSIPFQKGDRILTSISEYASNYIAFLQIAKRTGAIVEPIPNDEFGQVSINALESMIDNHVKLIAITHVPTNGGLVNPAAAIGRIARAHNILYLLDACQSVGQMPIDVNDIGCDFLSATGRKYLRGPRGTGFLYVRRSVLEKLEPPFLDLHAAEWTSRGEYRVRDDARRFENWETNYAGKIGLGVAIDYALGWGIGKIQTRVYALANELRASLWKIPGVKVHDLGKEKCGIVTFTKEGHDAAAIQRTLTRERINVSISGREYTRLDMESRGLSEVVRASVHYFNTQDEIDRFCETVNTAA